MQMQGRKEVPISAALHTLATMECNYYTVEKEALACLWAVEKLLPGCHFVQHMIQHSLLSSLSMSKASGRCPSSSIGQSVLLATTFEISYQKGEENLVPDELSSPPLPTTELTLQDAQHMYMISGTRPTTWHLL